jgi:hypothetical protein
MSSRQGRLHATPLFNGLVGHPRGCRLKMCERYCTSSAFYAGNVCQPTDAIAALLEGEKAKHESAASLVSTSDEVIDGLVLADDGVLRLLPADGAVTVMKSGMSFSWTLVMGLYLPCTRHVEGKGIVVNTC